MKKIKVSVVGTVGIPAKYGGFETLIEYLTLNLENKIDFTIFCSSKSYTIKKDFYNKASLKYIPLKANGIQSVIYDIISLFHATRYSDTILILGVSGCVVLPIFKLFYKKKRIIINIDGLEHRRKKWNRMAKLFLKYSESVAVKYGDLIITDNQAIKRYIYKEYGLESTFIAYAGDHVRRLNLTREITTKYSLPNDYALKVCRIEPENNIELILQAFTDSNLVLFIVGNWETNNYGLMLRKKYSAFQNIKLLNPIYDQNILNQLRSNCTLYIHGHSAGGTNPSLVEAMNLSLPILTFDCPYNRETTFNKAQYFKNSLELKNLINNTTTDSLQKNGLSMYRIAQEHYTWSVISQKYYEALTKKLFNSK